MIRSILYVPLLASLAFALWPAGAATSSLPTAEIDLRSLVHQASIQPGDLIFRRGGSWLSRAVVEMDPASDFSHVGVAVVDGSGVRVVHATPGGEDGLAGVVSEPLASYLAPGAARAVAVLRVPDTEVAHRAAAVAARWAREARPFDDAFEAGYDDASEAALYCTELVWKAYLHAGLDLLGGQLDVLELPLGPDRYVLPSSLMAADQTIETQRQPATKYGRDS